MIDKNKFKSKSAITLISLVLTIVLLVILVGVTFNFTLGRNGILNKALHYGYYHSIGFLEEKAKVNLVHKYSEKKMAEIDDLINKGVLVKKLTVKDNNAFYTYVFKKSEFTTGTKKMIKSGDGEPLMLQDVYGINSDLSVWYIDNDGKVYGAGIKPDAIDPNEKLNFTDDDLARAFERLVGKTRDNIVLGDVIGVTTLHLNKDGSTSEIKSLDDLKYLPGLKSLYLYDLKLDNVDGLKYLDRLKKVEFEDSTSKDFKGLGKVYRLQSLLFWCGDNDGTRSFYYINEGELDNVFDSIKDLTRLTGISIGSYYNNSNLKRADRISNDLQKIKNKENLKKIFIFNNELTGKIDLKGFTNLGKIKICSSNNGNNTGIIEIKNLNESKKMYSIDVHNNNLANLNGISGLKTLKYVSFSGNNNFDISSMGNIQKALSYCNGNIIIPIKCINESINISNVNEYLGNIQDSDLAAIKNNKNIKILNIGRNNELSFEKIKEVLPTLTNLQSLAITSNSNIENLDWMYKEENGKKVSVFPNLIDLHVDFLANVKDYSPIRYQTSLEQLSIQNACIQNLDFILTEDKSECALKNLKGINALYTNNLKDISAFSKENNIMNFLPYGSKIQDISYLKNSKVRNLMIGNDHSLFFNKNDTDSVKRQIALKNIDALNSMPCLNQLTIGTYEGTETSKLDIRDIQPCISKLIGGFNLMSYTSKAQQEKWLDQLSNCSDITSLYLVWGYFNNCIPEKISVKNCTNLRTLYIGSSSHYRNLEIGNAVNLENIYCNSILSGEYVPFPDISKATKIKQIEWYNNQMNDTDLKNMVNGLTNNPNIKNIYLNSNAIYNVYPLLKLSGRIEKIALESNNIVPTNENMQTFLKLKQAGLTSLYLKRNQILDYSLLKTQNWVVGSNDFDYKESEENYDIE